MFKVRIVSLGKILTFSTAVLYLGYLWYKRKRTLSHRQSDKKRPSSEPSELTKIDEQELIQAFEKTTCTLEISQIIVEEPLEGDSVICENIMEPTISQVKSKEMESFVDNSEVQEFDMKVITMMSIDQVMCIESNILSTIESLTENLNNLKLTSEEEDQVTNEIEVTGVVDTSVDSISTHEVKENCATKELSKINTRTELIKSEDHCECPKTVIIKKSKKDDEPMLFEGIKFKGKKKKSRKKNQARDTIKLPSDEQNENNEEAYITVKPTMKTNQMVEEDCDSAHSIDHSIDTNDVPNTIYSDIRSVVSVSSLNVYI